MSDDAYEDGYDEDEDDDYEFRPGVQPTRQETLAVRVGRLLQNARYARNLPQTGLAALVGVSQHTVSRFERGGGQPSTALIERMFGALDLQVRVETEPLGTDLDAEIERYSNLTEAELVDEVEAFEGVLKYLRDVPYVLSGRMAALLQGAPVSVRWLDVAVLERDLGDYNDVFERATRCKRWSERWNEFDFGPVDPRLPGPMRWELGFQELRLEVRENLPRTRTVVVGERTLRVRPLPDVEADYPDVARVLRRARDKAGGGPA